MADLARLDHLAQPSILARRVRETPDG